MTEGVLVTGATGFLGSHLLREITAAGMTALGLKRSTSDTSRVADLMERVRWLDADRDELEACFRDSARGEGAKTVVHCATNFGRGGAPASDIVRDNVLFPLRLLEAGARNGCRLFINIDTFFKPEYENLGDYSLSKQQFREWLTTPPEGMTVINVKLYHLYGENDGEGKFIPFIIRRALSDETRLELTPGRQKRDFLYVGDAVRALRMLLEGGRRPGPPYREYQLGSGESIPLREVVLLIRDLCENSRIQLDFGARPYARNEIMESRADIAGLRGDFDWTPEFSLRDGMRRTIDWYRGHPA